MQWTGTSYEFCIIDPDTLTSLWAAVCGDKHLTFNHLLGELKAYSGLGLIERVESEEREGLVTYQLLFDVKKYLSMLTSLLPQTQVTTLTLDTKPDPSITS